MKLKNYSLILLMGMSSSAFALNVYNKDGNTLDIYGRVEGKIASGQNSFAGSLHFLPQYLTKTTPQDNRVQ